jgi:hypothetical protein
MFIDEVFDALRRVLVTSLKAAIAVMEAEGRKAQTWRFERCYSTPCVYGKNLLFSRQLR